MGDATSTFQAVQMQRKIISSIAAPKNGDSTEIIPMAVVTPASALQKIPGLGLMQQVYTTTLNKNLGNKQDQLGVA